MFLLVMALSVICLRVACFVLPATPSLLQCPLVEFFLIIRVPGVERG